MIVPGRRRFLGQMAAVVVLPKLTQSAQAPAGTAPTDKRDAAVLQTVTAFVRAIGDRDVLGTVSTFHDNATVFFPGPLAPRANGKAEIEAGFRAIFRVRAAPVTINLRNLNLQLLDDNNAIVTAHLQDIPTAPVRESTPIERRTLMLHRFDKRWLIVHFHGSTGNILPPTN